MKLYSIKDCKSVFWTPFKSFDDVVALREFTNMVNSDVHSFVTENYKDLELWYVGDMDDRTGIITSDPQFIASGSNVKKVV